MYKIKKSFPFALVCGTLRGPVRQALVSFVLIPRIRRPRFFPILHSPHFLNRIRASHGGEFGMTHLVFHGIQQHVEIESARLYARDRRILSIYFNRLSIASLFLSLPFSFSLTRTIATCVCPTYKELSLGNYTRGAKKYIYIYMCMCARAYT